ncbi:hypothetical protein BH09SUM1_BH09SUM1_28130 [soil metagenome]
MLQQLRHPKVMKWGMWAVLIVTIPSFIAFYGFSNVSHDQGMRTDALVTVTTASGKQKLGENELKAAKNEAANYYVRKIAEGDQQVYYSNYNTIGSDVYSGLDSKTIADFAVGQVALRERLHKQNMIITDRQVNDSLKEAKITKEALQKQLDRNGMTSYEFAALQRARLEAVAANDTISRIAHTSLLELWQEYVLGHEQISVVEARVPIQTDAAAAIDPARVQTRYDELVAKQDTDVIEPARRVYQYVGKMSVTPQIPDPMVDEIKGRYESLPETDPAVAATPGYKLRQIIVPFPSGEDGSTSASKALAQKAMDRVNAGEDFAKVADETAKAVEEQKLAGAQPYMAYPGGLAPMMYQGTEKDQWGEPWTKFVSGAKAGDVSNLLETEKGYVIAKVESHTEPGKKSYEDAQAAISAKLSEERRLQADADHKKATAEISAKFRDAYKAETNLAGIAKAVNAVVRETSPTLSAQPSIPGIGDLSRDQKYVHDLKVGQISQPLQTAEGNVVVLRIDQDRPAAPRALEAVKLRIEQRLRVEDAAAAAMKKAEELRDRVVNNHDELTSAALEMNLTAEALPPFSRTDPPQQFRSLSDIGNQLERAHKGDVLIVREGSENFPISIAVIHLKDMTEPSRTDFLKELKDIEPQQLALKREGYVEDFRRDAVKDLKPVYDVHYVPPPDTKKKK